MIFRKAAAIHSPLLKCGAAVLISVGMIQTLSAHTHDQDAELSPDKRLENAYISFREVMHEPDKGIPRDLFDKARCIVIIPGVKKCADRG